MQFYKNQGIKEYKFVPIYGWLKDILFLKKNQWNDSLYQFKRISQDPEFKDEDILLGNVANQAFLTLIKPELINEFLQRQNEYEKYSVPLRGVMNFLGNGLARIYGDKWKKSRKVISNMFTFENITAQVGRIKEVSRKYINNENPEKFNIKYVFEKISGSQDLQVLLGAEVEKYKDSQGRHLGECIEQLSSDICIHYISPFAMIFGQKILTWNLRESDRYISKRMKDMRQFMTQILTDCVNREKDPTYQAKYPSYITFLLKAGYLQKEEEINELLATSFSLFMAAKDTTSKLTSMAIYNLIKHPEQYKLVFEEIQKYVSHDDYDYNDLQKLSHLHANLKETLRMDPSVPFILSRVAQADHMLGKYKIKKGTIINIGYLCNLYNEKYFKDPFNYNPSRWLDNEEDMKMKENHFVFIPFSAGPRNCIGQHLAMMQMKVMIVEFIKKFYLPQIPKDYDDEKILTQSYGFKNPLTVKLQVRN
ncbi:cytochrome P450 family monooxygenase (macronuclear) [Tetrahymena thermophila SB210]|uniref:Cytochrome P450 family monooxygenase n=2 Tax=Tetrahymena thermophila TaxID=5911 RepID=Q238W5_TETTS|nr:cytochrome P450 family monooxygenase [Tetrahymena thermophila SB210]EAR93105.1 cytochrome P450 family monooxygenase [Tetrahymena thermophila SB210]|eukprot:XP_001013350.1 cytochrome P450 family monooxygenase [Tetrahymena thermophila SB210]